MHLCFFKNFTIISNMTVLALLFTLSAIGISETVYLLKKRIIAEKPICPIGENCAVVLTSKYGKIFVIPNDVLGVVFYIAAAFISGFLVIGIEPLALWSIVLKLLVAIGAFLSLFFTYLQWRVIRAWCFWCLMSAFSVWFMGIILLVSSVA